MPTSRIRKFGPMWSGTIFPVSACSSARVGFFCSGNPRLLSEHILKLLGAAREKKLNGGQVDKCFTAGNIAFIILAQTTRPTQPGKSAFNHPSKGDNFKSFGIGITLHNLQNRLDISAHPLH